MKKVLVLGKIHDAGLQILRDASDVEFVELAEHVPELFDHLPGYRCDHRANDEDRSEGD